MKRHKIYIRGTGIVSRGMSRLLLVALLLTGLGASVVYMQQSDSTNALSGSDFRPGNIISDAVFFDGGRMGAPDVQNFLNARVPSCDTWGAKPYSGGQSRAQYGASKGYPAPYTCLRDYRQDTPSMPAEAGLCAAYSGRSNQTAAQIIADVGRVCGINQQALLVLLQKEQGLVTDEWPWSVQYDKATGFSCPDTAPCDPYFKGFFYQVYYAARQFKKYARDQMGYQAHRNNSVRYNPNPACGSSTVYIENQATAGLYTYTPYQPNSATIAWKLDGGPPVSSSYPECGAFGNINFFTLFNNWFGPTQAGSFLLRTVENAVVYLVTDTHKYPIADVRVLDATPFGPVGFVSQSYLDTKQTGKTLGRVIRDRQGVVYYFDSKIKLPFTNCGLVEDYGYSCEDSVLLTDVQIGSFVTGPHMTPFYRTTNGKNFYISKGKKHEILDSQSLAEAGLSGFFNVLTETPIEILAYDTPIVREGVIAQQRGNNNRFALTGSAKRPINYDLWNQTYFKRLPSGQLDSRSLSKISTGAEIKSLFYDETTNKRYVLGRNGRHPINGSGEQWGAQNAPLLEKSIQSQLPISAPADVMLVKSTSSATVYMLDRGSKRPISSWSDLLQIDGSANILTLPDAIIKSLPTGAQVMTQGVLVKSPNNATVYYVDGLQTVVPLTTFVISDELGIRTLKVYPQSVINAYDKNPQTMRSVLTCGGKVYWGMGGRLYNSAGSPLESAPVTPLPLSKCPGSARSLSAPLFLLGSGVTVYHVVNGVKHPIAGYDTYLQLGGNAGNTIKVSDYTINLLTTGHTL